MDYQTKYIVIKLKLTKHKGFYHVPKFDKYAYAQQHGITLNGEPIVQYEDDNIILIFEGFPHTDERPPLGIYQGQKKSLVPDNSTFDINGILKDLPKQLIDK